MQLNKTLRFDWLFHYSGSNTSTDCVTIDNIFLYGYETAARARTFSNEDLGYLQVSRLQKENCLFAIDFAVTILFEFFIAFS